MRFRKIIALALGLVVFGALVIFENAVANSSSPWLKVLLVPAGAVLIPISFELCRFALLSSDKEYRFFSWGYRLSLLQGASRSIRKTVALVGGLLAFGEVVECGILAANTYPLWRVILFGSAAALFIPVGFECCRYAFTSGEKEYRYFSGGYAMFFFDLAILLVALCLTVGTVGFQRNPDALCGGGLSAGFPIAFVCDNAGESPIDSWGKFDWADIDHLSIPGTFADILFYLVLLSMARSMLTGLFDRRYRNIRSRP
jgi:hypothetical protein